MPKQRWSGMSKKILAVDDSASMRQAVLLTLQEAGYEVVAASDGITLVRELRGLPNYKFVPMLILTTESSQEKQMDGKCVGATSWLVKPFNPPQLLATVARVI
jgi:two-component system, chemotaxis family, chemotaxis protein CheY